MKYRKIHDVYRNLCFVFPQALRVLLIIGESVCPLDELLERRVDTVEITLEAVSLDEEIVRRLKGAVAANRGDAQLFFRVGKQDEYRLVALAESSCRVAPSRRLTRDVEDVIGPDRVRYRARSQP